MYTMDMATFCWRNPIKRNQMTELTLYLSCNSGVPAKGSSDFCYLGSIVTEDGGTSKEVNARIQKSRGSFSKLRSVWLSKSL